MSKFCTKCGAKLADDDLFCGECGTKQENIELTKPPSATETVDAKEETPVHTAESGSEVVVDNNESSNESKAEPPIVHNTLKERPSPTAKKGKKMLWVIGGIVVVAIAAVLAIFLLNSNSALGKVDEIEQQLNEAFVKAWEGYDIGFEGVTEFEIQNVNEDTHDQTFSCFVMPSEDGVTGLRVMGLAKDGKVVQIQSVYVGTEDSFNMLSQDEQLAIMALPAFPVSIYKEDIGTLNEFAHFIGDMDVVNDGTSGPDNMRTVEGDIEYSYMGGTGNGVVMSTLTIRYLPAFPNGFFEDDDEDVLDNNEDPALDETNTPKTNVSYAVYDEKIAEYKTALTMGSDAFDTKYDYGYINNSINAMMVHYSYSYGGGISYAIFDVDENGVNELIFSDGYNIIDIYTIHNGNLIKLFENCDYGDRSRIHVLADGKLLAEGSSGASSGSCELYEIDTMTGKLSAPLGAYYCDGMGPSDYMTEYTYMSEDEYYDKLNKWKETAVFDILEWTLIAENAEPDWGWDDTGDSNDDEVVYSDNGKIKLGSYSSTNEDSWDYINLVDLTSDNILIFNTGDFAGVALMNGSVGTFNITGDSPDDDGTKESFAGTIAIDNDVVTVNITSSTEDIESKTVYKYTSAYFFGFNSMYPDAFSSFTSSTLGNKYISHKYLGTATSGMVNAMLVLLEDPCYHEYDFYKVTQSDGDHYYALGWFGVENWTSSGLEIDAYVHVYECKVDETQITLNYITRFEHSW